MNGLTQQKKTQVFDFSPEIASALTQRALALITGHRLLRATVITLWYMAVVSLSYYGAFLLRFDGDIPRLKLIAQSGVDELFGAPTDVIQRKPTALGFGAINDDL